MPPLHALFQIPHPREGSLSAGLPFLASRLHRHPFPVPSRVIIRGPPSLAWLASKKWGSISSRPPESYELQYTTLIVEAKIKKKNVQLFCYTLERNEVPNEARLSFMPSLWYQVPVCLHSAEGGGWEATSPDTLWLLSCRLSIHHGDLRDLSVQTQWRCCGFWSQSISKEGMS